MPKNLALAVVPSLPALTSDKPLTLDELLVLRNEMIRAYQDLPQQIEDVQREINIRVQSPMIFKLSTRQQEVLHFVRAKMSNKEIGAQLNVTERTIKFHVSRLLQKLGGKSRSEL